MPVRMPKAPDVYATVISFVVASNFSEAARHSRGLWQLPDASRHYRYVESSRLFSFRFMSTPDPSENPNFWKTRTCCSHRGRHRGVRSHQPMARRPPCGRYGRSLSHHMMPSRPSLTVALGGSTTTTEAPGNMNCALMMLAYDAPSFFCRCLCLGVEPYDHSCCYLLANIYAD